MNKSTLAAECNEVVKFGNSNPEMLDTANALVAFATGQELTINPDRLFDFYEFAKRLKKQIECSLSFVEGYVTAKNDSGEEVNHFSFAKGAQSVKIVDEAELIRRLKEDFGQTDEFIQSSSKIDPKLLLENLRDYTKEGLCNAFPGCVELATAKGRFLAK
ncbi:MAG: hypothetical protein MJZ26_11375 [Fibrobacter sp.]|nr:hypothetical protein [Fibrobacter sp.]